MWHSITTIAPGIDQTIAEVREPITMVLFNAGPSAVEMLAWHGWASDAAGHPHLQLELRSGAQRIVTATLVRAKVRDVDGFAALGARFLESQRGAD